MCASRKLAHAKPIFHAKRTAAVRLAAVASRCHSLRHCELLREASLVSVTEIFRLLFAIIRQLHLRRACDDDGQSAPIVWPAIVLDQALLQCSHRPQLNEEAEEEEEAGPEITGPGCLPLLNETVK